MDNNDKQLKDITIENREYQLYLLLLMNYSLKYERIEDFLTQFGLDDESEIVPYILDPENGYELSKYGHRTDKIRAYNGKRRMYVYNGIGAYHSCKTTRSYK